MGFPSGYTKNCFTNKDPRKRGLQYEDERMSLLGNTWSVPVVAWLLQNLLHGEGLCPPRSVQDIVDLVNPKNRSTRNLHHLALEQVPKEMARAGDGGIDAQRTLVRVLASGMSHKGSDVRISRGGSSTPSAWPRQAIPSKWWRWKTVASWKFKHLFGSEHINALELRAFLTALKWRVRSKGGLHKRFLHLLDSQVSIGVITKGRSSSRKLRKILEQIAAVTLASQTLPLCAFVRTDDNPSDEPSSRAGRKRKWGA